MLTLFPKSHNLHNPKHEIFRGERVPCFETPARADFVFAALQDAQHEIKTQFLDSSPIITQVHKKNYIDFLKSAWQQWIALNPKNVDEQVFPSVWPVPGLSKGNEPDNFVAKLGYYSMDNGTPLAAGTWNAVKESADATFTAATLLQEGTQSIFCALRPPGHHAGSDFMGGYCFINNAAVAAETLRQQGIDKIAILDVDYHHGNGTQEIFYQRNDVLVANIHASPSYEYPFFLGYENEKGEGVGEGYNFNYPLAAGVSSDDWFIALESATKNIQNYKPDALVVSLGLDTYIDDPLSQFNLTTTDFIKLGKKIKRFNLPTLLILEGGYATSQLGTNVINVLQGFENN